MSRPMRSMTVIFAILGLCGCATSQSIVQVEAPQEAVAAAQSPGVPPKANVVAAIKAAAARKLKDARSAQWERMLQATRLNHKGQPTEVVCGYVNAKNSFGAYTGAKPFVFFVSDSDLNLSGEPGSTEAIVLADMLKTFCAGLV